MLHNYMNVPLLYRQLLVQVCILYNSVHTLLHKNNLFSQDTTYVFSAINSNAYLLKTCTHLQTIHCSVW